MSAHHLFAPSSAHRWTVCNAAVAAQRLYPEQHSYDAAEGTTAHEMAATCLKTGLNADEVWLCVGAISCEGFDIPITNEMREYVQQYIDYVRALGGGMEVEVRMEFKADPDFGGTADVLVWGLEEAELHIVDFKYGKGVRVKAECNPQMMSYAVLALSDTLIGDIEKVVLHVHQPRIDNVDTWETTPERLVAFAGNISTAIARSRAVMKAMDAGKVIDVSEFRAGEHCRFCPHAGMCPGLAEFATKTAQSVFGDVTQATSPDLAAALKQADVIETWISAVRAEGLARAMRGEKLDGFKLVWKRAVRKWSDEEKVKELGVDNMIDVFAPPAIMSPAQMEQALGKRAVADTFGKLIASVSSGLTLVDITDKRAAVDPASAAEQVFTAVE